MTGFSTVVVLNVFLATDPDTALPFMTHLGMYAILVFLPFVVIAGTSFMKIAVVLAIVRSALGAPGVPPASVITALAAVLSMFVMAPLGDEMMDALNAAGTLEVEGADPFGFAAVRSLYEATSPPLINFLSLNTPPSEIDFYSSLRGIAPEPNPGLRILLPAFATGEIVEAFMIGFLVFVPFLVIDLIVANTLLALGMHMLSPTSISLPLKLLLFVAVGGWHILLSGLLVTYST